MMPSKMNPVELSQAVEAAIEASFAEPMRDRARALLLSKAQLGPGAPNERVQLATIRLAAGDLDKLQDAVEAATKDWRDVLYWTENPATSDEPRSWEELKRRLGLPE